jgi:predicted O-methyltransferase YrrM
MFFQISQYLNFLFNSRNQHGVHSPFIYKLVTKCFYTKIDKKYLNRHQKIRKDLLDNKNTIKVTDFGAGSKIFKKNERQISKVAKIAGISTKKTKILIKLIQYFKPNNVLEIGTSLGLGTSAIKIGHENSIITTLEGCPETIAIAQNLFIKNQLKNIKLVVGDFSDTIPKIIQNKQFDLVYFDGNHTKEATLEYFERCLLTTHNNSIFIFDDIYWNKEMIETWSIIKQHRKVIVTVDVFYYGIVFFRKEQEKEHFKIRV